jgi:GT2 family glycosyltransferase
MLSRSSTTRRAGELQAVRTVSDHQPSPVWAVIASHNRHATTLRCLRSLAAQTEATWSMHRVVLVDDGSTDGTADRVEAEFPKVLVSRHTTGDLYWGGSMAIGAQIAIEHGAHSLWMVNDDVEFDPDALARLLRTRRRWSVAEGVEPWVVGSTRSPDGDSTTYGGWSRRGRIVVRVELVEAPDSPTPCATTSFNSTLIPVDQFRSLGGFDPRFRHLRGDHDLGYRATRRGQQIVIASGTVGTCAANPPSPWQDPQASWRDRWRDVHSVKWYPPAPSIRYTFRHYGPMGPASFLRPYVLMVASHLRHRLSRKRRRARRAGRR